MEGNRALWWRVPAVLFASYLTGGFVFTAAFVMAFSLAWGGGPAEQGVAMVILWAGLVLAVGVATAIAVHLGLRFLFGPVTLAVAAAALLLQPTHPDAFLPGLFAAPVIGAAAALPLRWWIRVLATVVTAGLVMGYVVSAEWAERRARTEHITADLSTTPVRVYAPEGDGVSLTRVAPYPDVAQIHYGV